MIGADSRPAQKKHALQTLCDLCYTLQEDPGILVAIAAAGAIPPLVQLLGLYASDGNKLLSPDVEELLSPEDLQCFPVAALLALSENDDNTVSIAGAGAVPRVVQLLLPDAPSYMLEPAAALLYNLTRVNAEVAGTVIPAGAVPRLVLLLGPGSTPATQWQAAGVLELLSVHAGNRATVAAAGAIPMLVQLLGSGSSSEAQRSAAWALDHLSGDVANRATIAAAGAVPLLVQLLGPGSTGSVLVVAAAALANLAQNADNMVAIAAAGAIPLLVNLLGPGSSPDPDVEQCTAGFLSNLTIDDDQNTAAIVAAGGFSALVRLGARSTDPQTQAAIASFLSLFTPFEVAVAMRQDRQRA
ncbi:hypothetical protein FOA52_011047 [Chlamydomonas sp. UWO 241]|nr:hypothetical protein FOA52_011047 [Chlamydomonas sp. UWO 241]